jgi:ABC-type nitrate/sulfonate/bicarbonate transport system permease component
MDKPAAARRDDDAQGASAPQAGADGLSPAAASVHRARARRWAGSSLRGSQALIGLVILLVGWEAVTRLFHPLPVILPSPEDVAGRLAHLLSSSEAWTDLGISIARVLSGFALGTVSGVFIAIMLARNPFLDRSLHYVLVALRFVIPFAWVPIAAYWFGLSETGKVFITWYASFFVIVFQARAGIEAVPDLYIKVAQTFGMSKRQTLWQVILPAAWPGIVVGMRLGLSFAWVAILAAEMVNANSGIGYFINYSGQFLATNDVMAGMIMIGVLGFCTDQALSWAGRWALPGTDSRTLAR